MKRNTRILQPSQPKSPLPYKRYARRQTTARTWTFVKNWDDSKKDFPAKISPTAQVLVKADPKLSVRKIKDVKDLNSSSDGSSISDIFTEEGSDASRKPSVNSKKPGIPQESDPETIETERVLRSSSKKGISKREKEIKIETSTLKENLASRSLRSKLNANEISPRKDNSLASRSLRSKNNIDHLSSTEVSPKKDKSLRIKNIDVKPSDGGSENSPKKRSINLTVNKLVSETQKITSDGEDSNIFPSRTLRSVQKPSEASKCQIETLAKEKTENQNVNNKPIRQFHDLKTIEKEIVSVANVDTIYNSTDSDMVKQRLANTDAVEDSTDIGVVKHRLANTDTGEDFTDSGVVKRSRKKSGTLVLPVMMSSDKSPDSNQRSPEKVVLLHPETHPFRKSSEKKKRSDKEPEKEAIDQEDGHGAQSHIDKNNIEDHPENAITSNLDAEDSEMATVENDDGSDEVDGVREDGDNGDNDNDYDDDHDEDDHGDVNLDDGVEMSKDKQKSHQQIDGTKINSMTEDDNSDEMVMSNDEQISDEKSLLSLPLGQEKRSLQNKHQNNEKGEFSNVLKKGKMSIDEQIPEEKSSSSSSLLGKRKRSLQNKNQNNEEETIDAQISDEKSSILAKRKMSLPDKNQNDVEEMKERNVAKKGKMAGMKKMTSVQAADDRQEHNIDKTLNHHTVDKSINVVEQSVSQTSNGHQQKSPQQNKLAVKFKPEKKKTDHGQGQSLPIWCGGLHQRYKKDILDLDVVLDHVSNHLEEERNNCDTNAERKAIKKMMLYMKKEITDTIDKVESLKTMSISLKHSKKNIKELRQQLLKTEEDKSRLMSQIAEKKKQFNENLHRVNTWITGFEKLMHMSKKSTKISKNQTLLTYGCFPV